MAVWPERVYELGSVGSMFHRPLEVHVSLCMTEPDFSKNSFCPKNWENG